MDTHRDTFVKSQTGEECEKAGGVASGLTLS